MGKRRGEFHEMQIVLPNSSAKIQPVLGAVNIHREDFSLFLLGWRPGVQPPHHCRPTSQDNRVFSLRDLVWRMRYAFLPAWGDAFRLSANVESYSLKCYSPSAWFLMFLNPSSSYVTGINSWNDWKYAKAFYYVHVTFSWNLCRCLLGCHIFKTVAWGHINNN